MSELPPPPPAVELVATAFQAGETPNRADTKAAVKAVLAQLALVAPGASVEVRVPPYAAVQVVAGTRHRRGTPPALVQMSARTLLELATGDTTWTSACASGAVRASGERSDLGALFPVYRAASAQAQMGHEPTDGPDPRLWATRRRTGRDG